MSGPEARIQSKVVTWARRTYKKKLIARKNQAGRFGTNGWEDYEFLLPKEISKHMEFKAPGEQPTRLQAERHKELRALGHEVVVVDNVEQGKAIIKKWMAPYMRRAA